jgi:hypothetical protein
MSGLADQCESSPSLMALAMVPNIGSFVSFVCAQAGSLVQKWVLYMLRPPVNVSLSPRSRDDFRYEYYKTTLQSGRSLVRVGVIASGKGGGSDPIRCKQPISKHLLHLRITRSDVLTFYVSNCLVSARALKKQAFPVYTILRKS